MGAINTLVTWLNQNPWLNLVFLILAILSIAVSIVAYIKSKKEKSPCFSVRTFRLIEDKLNKIEAIEILYRGRKIDNLALSKIALWNRGKDTINANDIAPKDPIRLVLNPEYKLLGAEIVYTKTDANNFSITPDLEKGEVAISFDYFHTNEGLVIQIYHTGRNDHDVALHGTIKGVPKIIQLTPGADYLTDSFFDRLGSLLPDPHKVKPKVLRVICWSALFILVILLVLPVGIPLLLVDMLMKPFRGVPRQFLLG